MNKPISLPIRDLLEAEILSGALRPGARLDEASLGHRFGVSRTPIREALLQLASAGLVELKKNRGATISELSASKLVEMLEVFGELESLCGRLAARRATSVNLAAMRRAQNDCRKAVKRRDADLYYDANERFHLAIYDASQNGFLTEQAMTLHRRLKPLRQLQLKLRHRPAISLAEHEKILAMIERGDGESAAALLRAHVSIEDRFADLIGSLTRLHTPEMKSV